MSPHVSNADNTAVRVEKTKIGQRRRAAQLGKLTLSGSLAGTSIRCMSIVAGTCTGLMLLLMLEDLALLRTLARVDFQEWAFMARYATNRHAFSSSLSLRPKMPEALLLNVSRSPPNSHM